MCKACLLTKLPPFCLALKMQPRVEFPFLATFAERLYNWIKAEGGAAF